MSSPQDHVHHGHPRPHAAQPPPSAPAGTRYTCPMHPEIIRDAPGHCPICGMALEPMLPTSDDDHPELADFSRRFWWTLPLSLIVLALVKGDLRGIARARQLSELTVANMKQNLGFALVYNAIGVPLAAGMLYPAFGLLLSPMFAALAMSLSSVSVVGNALRLRG